MKIKRPLHDNSTIEEWDAEAKRLGVKDGETLKEETQLADRVIYELIIEEKSEQSRWEHPDG